MKDSEIFIIGANGQLGTALKNRYPGAKNVDIDELDITDAQSVADFDWSRIKIVLNAAAYTNVDGAETPEGRIAAWKVNSQAVGYLAKAALKHNLLVVHISTDYVFDGTKELHNENESFSPINVYGQSKAAGDLVIGFLPKHYILRTSWVIGEGKNFVRTMLDLGKKDINPEVVSDQIGRLTFTSTLVDAVDLLITSNSEFGTYNVSNDGELSSWANITREIFKLAEFNNTVKDVSTSEYYMGKIGIAPRPMHSGLDLSKIKSAGFTPKDWKIDLTNYVKKELAQ